MYYSFNNQPSYIEKSIIQKHTQEYKKHAQLLYNYTVTTDNRLDISKFKELELSSQDEYINLYRIKDDNCEKYHIGDTFQFKREYIPSGYISTTYSTNYPLLYTFHRSINEYLNIFKKYQDFETFKNYLTNLNNEYDLEEKNEYKNLIKKFCEKNNIEQCKFANFDHKQGKFLEFLKQEELKKEKTFCCLFRMRCKKGIIIENFSMYPQQYEVLIKNSKKFTILNISNGILEQKNSTLSDPESHKTYYANLYTAPNVNNCPAVEEIKVLDEAFLSEVETFKVNCKFIDLEEIED